MTDLDARLAMLTPQKRALYERLLRESGRLENVFPLAVFQEGMWFLEQLRPNNPAYSLVGAVRIQGELRVDVLAGAIEEVIRRHEVLRTTFPLRDGQPVQVVHPRMPVELRKVDLRGAPVAADDLEKAIATALGEPPPIEAGPLVRIALLRTAAEEWVLAVATHHLIADRASFGILLDDLSAIYEASCAGRPSPLPELPIQYGDFAAWQRQRREENRWAQDLAYWREHLAGAPAALELPTDRPRPRVQSFTGELVPIEVPESVVSRLAALANQRGATTYMALLAVFTVLLHRYSNQDDVVVGVPTSVRTRPELARLIGYFINTLPIRVSLAGDPSFAQVLDRVRAACLGGYEHQEVPFDMVVAQVAPARDLSRPPVYQVSCSHGREPVPAVAFGGARLSRVPIRGEGARFDLELQTFEQNGGLSGWFEYDRALFERATVARMAGHFQRLIEQAVADPERPIDQMELLTDAERQQILVAFNDTARQWPAEAGWIHQCFEQQVRQHPEAEAVRYAGDDEADRQSLSYRQLNQRANQLAHWLRRAGVGPDVLVGVAMERSPELVIALLAVLKAGGAYVPLDPEYPPARLAQMITDARMPVLLTQDRLRPALPRASAVVLAVDTVGDQLAAEPADDPDVPIGGDDLAYVIYTSGSTGVPKGVMNTHRGIRNRLLWMQDAFRLDATDRVLQKTPFSFDVSVWEFFWPLMVGATLVVARPNGHRDPGYLARTIRREEVTTIHFVPSMLQLFLAERVADCPSLRRVFCSGEALPRDLHDRFLAESGAQLHNLYGPTEAAVDVTHWPCHPEPDERPVPIGRPIANTQVYVLDRALRPVPIGVAGELHLGGDNLARGYLNQPALTAERFIDNPFATTRGARLYRTGDLARFRADGVLEFLGRLDHQVKLRGFRIELGEIEAALTDHEQVREAVVVARELRPGDVRLVGYVTAAGSVPPDPGALADRLRQRLPEYMVPAFIEVLDQLPLTPNGKVDRKALPSPDLGGRRDQATPFAAPRDELEDTLAGLWREVLGVDRVGRQDNFFDLGGHSLLMARLRAELAARTGHEVSMVDLFQHSTVASLAEFLTRQGKAAGGGPSSARERAEQRRRSQQQRQRLAHRRSSRNLDG